MSIGSEIKRVKINFLIIHSDETLILTCILDQLSLKVMWTRKDIYVTTRPLHKGT